MVVPRYSHAEAPEDSTIGDNVMTHAYYPSGNPRFNHVAMSVPADLLDEPGAPRLVRLLG